jgi:transposase
VRVNAEILEHWQAGRSICTISRSLDVSRPTVRKYVNAAEARGYHQGDPTPSQGWKAFIEEKLPVLAIGYASGPQCTIDRTFELSFPLTFW